MLASWMVLAFVHGFSMDAARDSTPRGEQHPRSGDGLARPGEGQDVAGVEGLGGGGHDDVAASVRVANGQHRGAGGAAQFNAARDWPTAGLVASRVTASGSPMPGSMSHSTMVSARRKSAPCTSSSR